ncbi:glycosyltransferase family 2 protein [Erwinia amylovora]
MFTKTAYSSIAQKVATPFGKSLACSVIHNRFGDAAMLIKTDIFHSLGGYAEDYGRGHEDREVYTRAAMAGYSLEVHAEPLYWYRVMADSMSHARKNISFDLTRNITGVMGNIDVDIYRLMQFCQGQYYKDYLSKH